MKWLGWGALLLAVLAGCAPSAGSVRPSLAAVPPPPSPVIKIALPGPRVLKATAVVSFEHDGDGRQSIEGFLEAARPDRLRLSTHLGFIQAFELTSRGDSFWVAIPHEDAILAGRKSEVRLTPLDPSRLAQALFLRPVESESLEVASQQRDTAGVWLQGSDALGTYRLRLDVRDRPVIFTRSGVNGLALVRIDFERYAEVHGGTYPRRIRWTDPVRKQSLTFDFDEVRLDGAADPGRFEPSRDPNLRVIPWSSWEEMFAAPR